MGKMVEKKKDKVSTVIPLKRTKSNGRRNIVEKDYKKMLEEIIQEKILIRKNKGLTVTGKPKENLDKKKRWMGEIKKVMLEIKDTLEESKLINVFLNDLNNLIIETMDYDDAIIVKTGFRLNIEFLQRSTILNNPKDCYFVQLLGKDILQDNMKKFYDIDTLMEFIMNYCSEYIAEQSIK